MNDTSKLDDREEYERLLHFVRRPGPRFGLALARYTDLAVARALWERAIVDLAATGHHAGLLEIHHDDDARDLVQAMLDAIASDSGGTLDALFIVGLDRLLQDAAGHNRAVVSIVNLNLRRDELPDLLATRVVWWISHASYPAFATLLRDMDEVLLTAFEFVSKSQNHVPPNPPDYLPGWMSFAATSSINEIRDQAKLLTTLHERTSIGERASLAAAIANLHLSIPDAQAARTWLDLAAQEFEDSGQQSAAAQQRRRLAGALLFFGEIDRAETEALRALDLARTSGVDHELVESYDVLVSIQISRGNANEAILVLERDYFPLAERLGDARSLGTAFCRMADALVLRGDLDRAMDTLQRQALPLYTEFGEEHGRAVVLGRISDILEQRGDLEAALRIRRDELPIYEQIGDYRSRAITLGKIADILLAHGDIEEAKRIHLDDELPIYERLGDVRAQAATLGRIAHIHTTQGEVESAAELLSAQLAIYERIGDARGQADVLVNVADLATRRSAFDEAENIIRQRVLPVYERISAQHGTAIALSHLSTILRLRGRETEARELLETRVLPAFQAIGDLRSEIAILGNLASIRASEGDRDGALQIRREKQLPIAERVGDVNVLVRVHHQIAKLLVEDKPDEAIALLRNRCLPIVEQLADIREQAAIIGTLADAHRFKGEFDAAMKLRRDEQLPIYEALGDIRERAICLWHIAYLLKMNGDPDDHDSIIRLLETAYDDALRLGIPEAQELGKILAMERTGQAGRIWLVLHQKQ